MTEVQQYGGGGVAEYDPDSMGNIGLEDVEASDLRLPRINIDHKKAVFVNSLTKEEFPTLTIVTLGLVKQRILWPEKQEDDSKPRCKSTDNQRGFPNVDPQSPARFRFPWDESNFDPSQAQPVEIPADGSNATHPEGWSSNGRLTLPCASCSFAKWGKDLDSKSTPPPCNEQHTYPLLYMQQYTDESGQVNETVWVPAILTVQRSAITNSKAYINGFAQAKQPFFTQYTGLTLRQESRGRNEYCVPEFRKMGPTERNMWGEYGMQLRSIRGYLRAAPRAVETTEGNVPDPATTNVNTPPTPAPVQPAAPAPTATVDPTPEPAPPAPQAPAPATPPPPTPAPAPAAPQPQTAAPAAPPAAPPASPAPPAPPTTPAATQQPSSPQPESDLPF